MPFVVEDDDAVVAVVVADDGVVVVVDDNDGDIHWLVLCRHDYYTYSFGEE